MASGRTAASSSPPQWLSHVGGSPHPGAAGTTDDARLRGRQPPSIALARTNHASARHRLNEPSIRPARARRSDRPTARSPRRVVIAGAGVGALEALLALRALVPRGLQIDVVAPGESFLYRPVSIAESLREAEPPGFDLDALLRHQQIHRHVDALERVDVGARTVHTRSGATLRYDELIIATGPRMASALPGALALRGGGDVPAARETIHELEEGRLCALACVVPTDSHVWPIPIYELALAAAARAPHASVSVVTAEPWALAALGPAAGAAVAALLAERGVSLVTGAVPVAFEGGTLRLGSGRSLEADRVIALPRLSGPAIAGLPADDDGFLPIDHHGQVLGIEAVYAAGDVTDFPIKQGALAAAQANSIARLIAARAGASVAPAPFRTVARGLLLSGSAPRYVRISPEGGAHSEPTGVLRGTSSLAQGALWWPFSRSVGRHLAALLAAPGGAGARRLEAGAADSAALWMTLADHDARAGDLTMALDALERAEMLGVTLPARFAHKRDEWWALTRSAQAVATGM
jgi:sulfide:quinone oxidoreductase